MFLLNELLFRTLSGDWLLAMPITSCGLRLDDEAVRVGVGYNWVSVFVPHQCQCGSLVDANSNNRNLFGDKSASFRCDGRLFHSQGPATANALSLKALYVRVTTNVMFGSLWNAAADHERQRQDGSRRPGTMAKCQTTLVNERGHLEVDALAYR